MGPNPAVASDTLGVITPRCGGVLVWRGCDTSEYDFAFTSQLDVCCIMTIIMYSLYLDFFFHSIVIL